ncbi:phage gp6-like head-tail connector protein [Streptomyces sp. NPDC057363]|uniref:phage gp6-like head-tail connector protein n=1 Tax=Streptomyces sp. NPDC057363 TaxID=3346107 RepID=UPI00362F3E27
MALATIEDVASRLGRPVPPDEIPRITAFIADVTGLIEDYCGRDVDQRQDQELILNARGGYVLPVPPRYLTGAAVSAALVDGQAVTGWTFDGQQLVTDGTWCWPKGPVTITASWGFPVPPAGLRAIVCSEVIRWLSVAPGIGREKVGEVEVEFTGASSTQTLSGLTRSALGTYRRRGIGVLALRREGPHVYGY